MASQKDKLIAEALKLVEKGQHERAVKAYLGVVKIDDKDVRVWLKIGDLYTKLRRNHEAAETYERVAQLYSDQGFYTKAIAVFKQILKLDPTMVEVYEKLANLYKQMGLLPDAIEQYMAVATHHQARGDMRSALAAMKQMVELDPQNVGSRVKLAEMYSKEQMVREAIDEFARAADHLHEQERWDDYLKVAERLLFHAPDNRPVSREIARIYLRKGDARRALPRLQVCFKADPSDADTLSLLADAFEALGQRPKAVSVLKELARIHGDNGAVNEKDAVWRRILQLDGNDGEANRALGEPARPAAMRAPSPPAPAPVSIPTPPVFVPASPVVAQPPQAMPRERRMTPPPAARSYPTSSSVSPPTMSRLSAADSGFRTPTPTPGGPASAVAAAAAGYAQSAPSNPTSEPHLTSSRLFSSDKIPAVSSGGTGKHPLLLGPMDETEVQRTLAETDVFVKYSLHQKALEHIKLAVERAPEHIGARDKLKTLYLSLGRKEEALGELRVLAEQTAGTPREIDFLREMLELDHTDEWATQALLAAEQNATFAPPTRFEAPVFQTSPLESMDLLNAEPFTPAPSFEPIEAAPAAEAGAVDAPDAVDAIDLDVAVDVDVEELEEIPPQDLDLEEMAPIAVDASALEAAAAQDQVEPVAASNAYVDPFAEDFALPGEPVAPDEPSALAPPAYDDDFRVDVEGPAAADAPVAADEIEDRFGADLDEEPAPLPAAAGEEIAFEPAQPEESFAGISFDDDEGTAVAPPHGIARSAPAAPAAADVDDFDFSSFDDPTAGVIETTGAAARLAPPPEPTDFEAVDAVDALAAGPAKLEQAYSPDAEEATRFAEPLPSEPPEPSEELFADEIEVESDIAAEADPVVLEAAAPESLGDELDEADFFREQGLYEEARDSLNELLTRHPNHPTILARLAEVNAALGTSDASESEFGGGEATVAMSLEDVLAAGGIAAAASAPARGRSRNVVDVGVSEDDFESHFELGIAYREMGLFDQAIAEFRLAMRDPAREVQCHMMIGTCFLAQNRLTDAIHAFKQGLYAEGIQEDEELSLYYELGAAYEGLRDNAEALYYYERISKRKPRYRDVPERMKALSAGSDAGFGTPAAARK